MSKKLQRAFSSILAFIMLCSCVIFLNVSSVFAATAPSQDDSGVWTYTTVGIPKKDGESDLETAGFSLSGSASYGTVSVTVDSEKTYAFKLSNTKNLKKGLSLTVPGTSDNEYSVAFVIAKAEESESPTFKVSTDGSTTIVSYALTKNSTETEKVTSEEKVTGASTMYLSTSGNSTVLYSVIFTPSNSTTVTTYTVVIPVQDTTGTAISDATVVLSDGTTEYKATESATAGTYAVDVPADTLLTSISVSVDGYEDYSGTIGTKVSEDTTLDTVTLTAIAYDASGYYVGYTIPSGTTVAGSYTTITNALNALPETGGTIYINDGTYTEQIVVTKSNVKFVGESTNAILTYNDYAGKDSVDENFHNPTLAINAAGFSAENMTIKNTAETDYSSAKANAPAVSVGSSTDASATFTSCNILAARDTLYTGSDSQSTSVTLTDCTIEGFQDVVCGSGKVTVTNCTMVVNSTSDARLFAPRESTNGTVFDVSNLTIQTSVSGTNNEIALARPWVTSDTYTSANNVFKLTGYTTDDNAATRIENSATNNSLYGFDKDAVGSSSLTLTDVTKNYWFLVKENASDAFYNTTYAAVPVFSELTAVTSEQKGSDSYSNAYRVIGTLTSALAADTNVSKVGFDFYVDGTLTTRVSDSTVYQLTGDDSTIYSVNFVTGNVPNSGVTAKAYVEYSGCQVEGATSADVTVSSDEA